MSSQLPTDLPRYECCFIASEAVDWCLQVIPAECKNTREGASQLLQEMMDRGMFKHVVDDKPFIDGYYFYRFRVLSCASHG